APMKWEKRTATAANPPETIEIVYSLDVLRRRHRRCARPSTVFSSLAGGNSMPHVYGVRSVLSSRIADAPGRANKGCRPRPAASSFGPSLFYDAKTLSIRAESLERCRVRPALRR